MTDLRVIHNDDMPARRIMCTSCRLWVWVDSSPAVTRLHPDSEFECWWCQRNETAGMLDELRQRRPVDPRTSRIPFGDAA